MDDPQPVKLSDQAIGSVNILTETELNQSIPIAWNDQPPLLDKYNPRRGIVIPETQRLLKAVLRFGIPPPLRCAVQISNVMQAVHPHQSAEQWHAYRTLAKVRTLDFCYDRLLERIVETQGGNSSSNSGGGIGNELKPQQQQQQQEQPDSNNRPFDPTLFWKKVPVSDYGRTTTSSSVADLIPNITPNGQLAHKRVLIGLQQTLGMATEFAPLIPILSALLLTHMSESYTFCAIREMGHAAAWFFPISRREHSAWCCAFSDILFKLHPQTAEYLEDRGVLDIPNLSPIFTDFFLGVLPLPYVLRILDIYTLEGSKVIYRFGVALLVLYKKVAAENLVTISNNDDWWTNLKFWTHSNQFQFEVIVRKAYGVHGHGIRKRMRFPRRAILRRIIKLEEERIRQDELLNDEGVYVTPPAQPLGLVKPTAPTRPDEIVATPTLAQTIDHRQSLAEWLPLTLRLTNLNLLYSTNTHGRTLERLYTHVKHTNHTLLLCEVLEYDCVIGMYASQTWRPSSKVYGDGACFLFRLTPDAKAWKWQPRHSGDGGLLDNVDLESDDQKTALLEQFMVGRETFLSMGGNPDGSCGLRLNEDLTTGESSPAVGFENEPLHGVGRGSVFAVGLVEVYGLVRQIDGRPV